jgi:hypothetical protein
MAAEGEFPMGREVLCGATECESEALCRFDDTGATFTIVIVALLARARR